VTRRFKIVEAAAAVARQTASDDLLRRSAHSRRPVLVEMTDNVIPRLLHDKLISSPSRGNYVLTASGIGLATKGPSRRSVRLASGGEGRRRVPRQPTRPSIGSPYKQPPTRRVSQRDQFLIAAWDLSEQDAQTVQHEQAVARAAALVLKAGLNPLLPAPGDPMFDLAYERGRALFVVEAKTLPKDRAGQRQQIRLGLGQVLEYACALAVRREELRPILLLASEAPDEVRRVANATCRANGVRLWIAPVTRLPR
jgi:hypothetical protein